MSAEFKYIGKKRRTKEDPRFVAGHGRYVADIARRLAAPLGAHRVDRHETRIRPARSAVRTHR